MDEYDEVLLEAQISDDDLAGSLSPILEQMLENTRVLAEQLEMIVDRVNNEL